MMTDATKGNVQSTPIQTVRVVGDIPVVFSDGVMSHSYIRGVSKYYLYRTDSSPDVSDGPKNIVVAQVVMSATGFAGMLHFFQHRLKLMIDDGAISQAEVDQINKTVYETTQKANVSPG
jgi:hypothetical protein